MKFRLPDIVAINGNIDNSITIYPNPNKGEFTIHTNQKKSSRLNLEIINLVGNVVYSDELLSEDNTFNLNLFYLSKGAYFVKMTDEFSSTVNKLIIE